jgi:hypothetical protein
MDVNIFTDKKHTPTDAELRAALGKGAKQWDTIVAWSEEAGDCQGEWKHYGAQSGWLRKAMQKKRNLFFVIPRAGHFLVAFTFGQAAVDEVMASKASRATKEALSSSRKYAEGQSVKLDSRERDFLKDFKILLDSKR